MKNKFLQNSKDILSRSFNPVKCKTSLRLAGSRLKLLRNKKEVQVKQMRREIAGLLESGQDQTARIRVEHVIREEKMIAAYDLLEIYCELIVARLPIIESQKNCPIDLKEAIASLVFAAPRCGDVPELLDVRKNFSAKYGKDFTTAAIELRPQCGVGRMLVEKLSATAPDGQTKIKILNAIANEHNVKWDPKSFEEKDLAPPSDLSSGPSRKQSELYAEPTHYEAADIQACLSDNKMHGAPLNFSQQDAKISAETEKLASAKTFGVSPTFQPEAKLPALSAEKAQLFQGDSDTNPLDKQRWTMEFKDAASAAQVAAESAEQASMAARAAAELASHGRILGQYSAESYKPDAHTLKDEGPETHPNSKFCSKIFSESSSIEHAELQNEEVDGIKRNDLKAASILKEDGSGGADSGEYSQSTSSKYKASADINSLVDSVSDVDEYSRSNSLKEVYEGEMSMKEQSFRYEAETAYGSPEKAENLIQGRIGKQPSLSPSGSQSSISDDVNVFSNSVYQKFVNDSGDDTFVGIGNSVIHGEAPQTSFHESAALVFDKSDSDIDDHEADKAPTYDEQNLEFHLPSLVQESPELLSVNTDSWSPRSSSSRIVKSTSLVFFSRRKSSTDFPDNMTGIDNSELDDFAPMTFDDSGGETSESDEDTSNLHSKVEDSRDFLHEHKISGQSVGLSSKDKGYSAFSSDDELNSSEEMHWKRNQVDNFDAGSPEKFSLEEPSAEQPTLGSKESLMESKEVGNESSPENVERLNFGKLTGGFRHKAHNHLPFMKNRLDVSSSGQKEAETTPTITGSTTPPVESPKIGTVLDHKKSSKTPDLLFESDSDSSEEEESSRQSFGHKHAPSTVTIVKTKPSLGASDSIFGSDDSDNDEEFPKSSLTRKSHLRSGISRRTKVYPSSGANSNTKMRLRPEALDSDAAMDRKPTTSYNSETPGKSESQRSSRKWENQQPISEGATSKGASSTPAKSNFWEPSEQIDSEKASSLMNQEPEIWIRSEAHDFDVSLGRKSSNSKSPDTTQQEFQSPRRNTSQYGNSEQPTPAEMDSKPTIPVLLGTPEKPSSGKSTSTTVQDESSTIEEISNPQLKPENENPRTATSSKHDGNKKPSHVHPKLPDYDTLIQSLRTNHS